MKKFEDFVLGVLWGVTFTCIVIVMCGEPQTITSTKRITPELELTTDGKKIDTLYIYKK